MTRVAYLESADQPGLIVEYIEGGMMRELIAAGVAAARHWDGTDPVRELG
ncbi:hypothetical protein [Gordonia malaquae]|nr:hypothetical protein [Gordonia malaquae]